MPGVAPAADELQAAVADAEAVEPVAAAEVVTAPTYCDDIPVLYLCFQNYNYAVQLLAVSVFLQDEE